MRELSLEGNQLADIAREVLARGGLFHFRARGSSMCPFLRGGDVLTVEPADHAALCRGDVVLYGEPGGRTCAHRVVDSVQCGERKRLLVRGDAHRGKTQLVSAEEVLGRVAVKGREKERVHLNSHRQRSLALWWSRCSPLGPLLLACASRTRRIGSRLLARLQGIRPYRAAARLLLGRRVIFRHAIEADAGGLAVLYGASISALSSLIPEAGEGLIRDREEDGAVIVAAKGAKVVGAASIHPYRDDQERCPGWWITGMTVRVLWRGAAIGKRLTREALRVAAARGARSVHLDVSPRNSAAHGLYRKVGFRHDETLSSGRERTVMSIFLEQGEGGPAPHKCLLSGQMYNLSLTRRARNFHKGRHACTQFDPSGPFRLTRFPQQKELTVLRDCGK